MKKIIHKLRQQPEEVRKHILSVTMIIFAIILIFLWIYSLGNTLTDSDTKNKMNQDLKPFSALKDNMVDGYNSISQPSPDTDLKTQ